MLFPFPVSYKWTVLFLTDVHLIKFFIVFKGFFSVAREFRILEIGNLYKDLVQCIMVF